MAVTALRKEDEGHGKQGVSWTESAGLTFSGLEFLSPGFTRSRGFGEPAASSLLSTAVTVTRFR